MTPTNLEELKRAAEGEWTEGIREDGAVILRDGAPVPISEFLEILNNCSALISELEAERERNEWRPIETAPKDGTPILLGWEGNFHALTGHYEGKWGHLGFDWGFIEFPNQPTRWMPVPMCPARAHFQSQEASDGE